MKSDDVEAMTLAMDQETKASQYEWISLNYMLKSYQQMKPRQWRPWRSGQRRASGLSCWRRKQLPQVQLADVSASTTSRGPLPSRQQSKRAKIFRARPQSERRPLPPRRGCRPRSFEKVDRIQPLEEASRLRNLQHHLKIIIIDLYSRLLLVNGMRQRLRGW